MLRLSAFLKNKMLKMELHEVPLSADFESIQ